MNKYTQQVRKFYHDIWDNHDAAAMSVLLHNDFTFRGSLGVTTKGHAGFSEYVDSIHSALADYHCNIEDMVCENKKVFARMVFSGVHTGELLGYAPTNKKIAWAGAALFTFRNDKIADLWVLGDLKTLEQQISS